MFYRLSEITLFIKGVENLVDTVQSSNLLLIHVHYFIGAVTRYYETRGSNFLIVCHTEKMQQRSVF